MAPHSQWTNCARCLTPSESVYEMPCCFSTSLAFCLPCLKASARCYICKKHFDIKRCQRAYPMVQMISQAQTKTCPHPRCQKPVDILLYSFHVANCPLEPSISSSMIETLDPNYVDPEQVKLQNMEKNYMKLYASKFDTKSGMYNHVIIPSDTLMGLSLKYGVQVNEIKSTNGLFSGNIHERSILKIPIKDASQIKFEGNKEDVMKRRLVNNFKKDTKILEDSEALFYLESSNFDVDEAMRCFMEDNQWEHCNPIKESACREVRPIVKSKKSGRSCALLEVCSFDQETV
eukprot:TRINITY_DN1086_c0_g1_i1.p1 TRINITY_DN1086_c0_g1~~TRINITY_DN1086_c0_g1_i1.p1  ORF type:complete len:289 (-),score=102.75 TRINITY_DN1086_c0_g1_i1:124-990(-)